MRWSNPSGTLPKARSHTNMQNDYLRRTVTSNSCHSFHYPILVIIYFSYLAPIRVLVHLRGLTACRCSGASQCWCRTASLHTAFFLALTPSSIPPLPPLMQPVDLSTLLTWLAKFRSSFLLYFGHSTPSGTWPSSGVLHAVGPLMPRHVHVR